jgi:hypothetical protein
MGVFLAQAFWLTFRIFDCKSIVMTTASLKKKLIAAISQENNKELLELFNFLLKDQSSDGRISKKQYNDELDAAMKRIDSGKYLTQSQVEKLAKKW